MSFLNLVVVNSFFFSEKWLRSELFVAYPDRGVEVNQFSIQFNNFCLFTFLSWWLIKDQNSIFPQTYPKKLPFLSGRMEKIEVRVQKAKKNWQKFKKEQPKTNEDTHENLNLIQMTFWPLTAILPIRLDFLRQK